MVVVNRMFRAALALMLGAGAASAQVPVIGGAGAVLRALDKVSGQTTDIDLAPGGSYRLGRMEIVLRECRYPQDDPQGDAFAFVTIGDPDAGGAVFAGWMIASAPALNALDHPRYDVWVLRCKTS